MSEEPLDWITRGGLELFVEAIGVSAPGLNGWQSARAVLRGVAPYVATELPPYQPQTLPANERRRATLAVRQAFRAAEDALAHSARPASELASVFASSDADMNILHRICEALAQASRVVSPTDFHNSVHNAAAGYWSIAAGARRTSTSIGAYDVTFAAGLLEAATLLLDEAAVLLVAYDIPLPEPLSVQHPIDIAASAALLLATEHGPASRARLRLSLQCPVGGAASVAPEIRANTLNEPALETLRLSNPVLRALPLLRALARGSRETIHLQAPGSSLLRIDVMPLT